MAGTVFDLLFSSAKLDRDKGVLELNKLLKDGNGEVVNELESEIVKTFRTADLKWEVKHGCLMGGKAVLSDGTITCGASFQSEMQNFAILLLEDKESRVRLAAGEVMGVLCMKTGSTIYVSSKEKILNSIKDNLERKSRRESESSIASESTSGEDDYELKRSTSAEQIFHDTAGWRSLETWMKCLQCVIEGCSSGFNSFIDQELLDLVFETLTHTNRFVRETGYYVCSALVACNYGKNGEMLVPLEENMIYKHGDQFASHLSEGLADNWSQVRLASSVAARKFLLGLQKLEVQMQFYSKLLPPLCLNRYYVAEGVRIYNQDTWKLVTHGEGKQLVEKFIKEIVEFYISQSEADNHAVREAACACIAELGSKIEKDAVRPYIPSLLDALLVCFKDESWPVRDASCVACGNFVLCFPEESRGSMDSLYPLFYENLEDNIPSVRQGAAAALANVVRAYKTESLEKVLTKLKEGLEGLEKQSENVEKYSNLDKGPATYGVVKKLRDNDMELHENNPMFSCGSLAPKMGRGKRGGGCMDHQFKRPSEPWELTDGCVYILGELSQVAEAKTEVSKLLPLLAKASGYRHYTQHLVLLETMCKQLPIIAKGIEKRTFKMHLEMFFDAIFYAVTCDNALTSTAASQCLSELSTLLGPNIMKGRVEQYDPRYLQYLPPPGSGPPGSSMSFPIGAARPPPSADFGPLSTSPVHQPGFLFTMHRPGEAPFGVPPRTGPQSGGID